MHTVDSHDRFATFQLKPDERPKKLYEYYVSGRGTFPWDMLRLDRCWPATGEDAAKLIRGDNPQEWNKVRSIKMLSYREPTIDRWSSFVWSVGRYKL